MTIYDACYVVLAKRLDAPLVTGDERLARCRHSLGVQIVTLEEIS